MVNVPPPVKVTPPTPLKSPENTAEPPVGALKTTFVFRVTFPL